MAYNYGNLLLLIFQRSEEQVKSQTVSFADAAVQVNITARRDDKQVQVNIRSAETKDQCCQIPPPPLDEETLQNIILATKKDHDYCKVAKPYMPQPTIQSGPRPDPGLKEAESKTLLNTQATELLGVISSEATCSLSCQDF